MAIEWGYKLLPQYKDAEAEKAYINSWIIERRRKIAVFWFGTENQPDDPFTK